MTTFHCRTFDNAGLNSTQRRIASRGRRFFAPRFSLPAAGEMLYRSSHASRYSARPMQGSLKKEFNRGERRERGEKPRSFFLKPKEVFLSDLCVLSG
jgi:hypothetical protein